MAGYMHPHSFLRLPNGNVLATFQHALFRVMHALGSLIRCKGRHEVSIRWGGWIGVNHCEKVVAYFCAIARPDKQVVTLS
jgi:hypothetical protein